MKNRRRRGPAYDLINVYSSTMTIPVLEILKRSPLSQKERVQLATSAVSPASYLCPLERQSSHTHTLQGSFSFGAKLTAPGEMPMGGRQGSTHLATNVSKAGRQAPAAVKTPHNQKASSNNCALTRLPKVKVPEIDLHHGKEQEVTAEMFCSKCKSLLKAGTRRYPLHFFWTKPYCLQTLVFPSIKYKSSGSQFLITINRGCPSEMDFNTLLLND
ncbi:hypothetical protein MG293_011587 [Ovis ammon polii]|uniref:Uncharacterized protein n=1 Tax=Ovis ammon polii TaxID=230172 RepID=A0AAD4U555_OVIAM|nr:hypothetical protein MG293_011587 [Ovis ammon polii]